MVVKVGKFDFSYGNVKQLFKIHAQDLHHVERSPLHLTTLRSGRNL
jgi:hypothetical protein